jgi:ATP-binding cassette subfamily C (CFTR/MRP) protein 1
LNGISTIRSYARKNDFVTENNLKLSLNIGAFYVLQASNRWLAVRLELLGTAFVTLTTAFCIMERDTINPGNALHKKKIKKKIGIAGLMISYALLMTGVLTWLVRMATETETNMVSVERVLQYTNVEVEALPIIPGSRPPSKKLIFFNMKNIFST